MKETCAYDLDYFAPKTEEEHERELKESSLRLVQSKRNPKTVSPISTILIGIFIVIIAIFYIYTQVVLTELTAQINSYTKTYSELQNIQRGLNGKIESLTSLKSLEEAATTRLGLAKVDADQITYVNLTSKDEIIIGKVSFMSQIKLFLNGVIDFLFK